MFCSGPNHLSAGKLKAVGSSWGRIKPAPFIIGIIVIIIVITIVNIIVVVREICEDISDNQIWKSHHAISMINIIPVRSVRSKLLWFCWSMRPKVKMLMQTPRVKKGPNLRTMMVIFLSLASSLDYSGQTNSLLSRRSTRRFFRFLGNLLLLYSARRLLVLSLSDSFNPVSVLPEHRSTLANENCRNCWHPVKF